MARRLRHWVAPAYLLLCLVLGGSGQGMWGNLLLQLVGIAIIAWAALARRDEPLGAPARQLFMIILFGLGIVAVQLVPLSGSLWPHLGGRELFAAGYGVLGIGVPARPLSLTPYETFRSLLGVIPPLAMLCAIVGLRAYRRSWLVAALLTGLVAGILLGALQVTSGDPRSSPWYLYATSSFGVATGFFANSNHMATLLLVALPFIAALLASVRRGNLQRYSAGLALAGAAVLVIVVGIALNRSLAAYLLVAPVFVASAAIAVPLSRRVRLWAAVVAGLLVVGAVLALWLSPVGQNRSADVSESVTTRAEMLSTSLPAVGDFLPFGAGLGSFEDIYPLYEDQDAVGQFYINHAHNDYVELALETGLLGIMLMLVFLLWWAAAVWRIWRFADAGPYARAASIASAVILIQSLVEFPLRTAAIAGCFAMCVALLIERRSHGAVDKSDLWPTRHVVLP